jgi:hypothetical protein
MNGRPAADDKQEVKNGNIRHRSVADMNRVVSLAVAYFRAWILRNGAVTAGLLIPLAIVYGPALRAHIQRSMNPFIFNFDVGQVIFAFFQYYDAGLFPHDYFATYYCASLPIGYRALYRIGASLWDPAAISKVLPYILLVVTVIAVAAAARRLAGYFGAFLAAALILSSSLFLFIMAGGLPRAFAFPALALTSAALVYGKPRFLATIVCVSAAFYPPVAIQSGIVLAIWLFVLPASDRGDAADWPFSRRARLVIAAASISALILLPELLGSRAYGRSLGPRDVTEYPERGAERYGWYDRPPFKTFPEAALQWAAVLFRSLGATPRIDKFVTVEQPWSKKVHEWAKVHAYPDANSNGDVVIELLTGALLIGGSFVAARDSVGRRFLLLGAAAWFSHFLARTLTPFLYGPERYVLYAVPILLVVLLPAVGAAIGARLAGRFIAFGRGAGVIAIAAMVLLPFAGRGSADAGLDRDVTSQQRLYDFLRHLPKDVLIAGWPTDLDNVPYVSRRQVFISAMLNHSYQRGYADEMRRRMRALIDAYFAADRGALERLRDDFGVTHLIFQQSILEKPPGYFKPFSDWIQKAFDDGRTKGFEIPRQLDAAKVFSDGPLIVIDLRRLNGL